MKNLNDKQKFILDLAQKGIIAPDSKDEIASLIIECFKASDEDSLAEHKGLLCDGLTVRDYNIISNYVKDYLAKRGDLYVSKIRENILRQDFFVSAAAEYTFVTERPNSALLDHVLWFLCDSGELSRSGNVISLTAKNGDLNADSK